MRARVLLPAITMVFFALWGRSEVVSHGQDPRANPSSIVGVVRNRAGGPGRVEAGVWVIAETHSLASVFRRIVVTDDRGRFVVPALPDGRYEVWVRGYGLRDSDRVPAAPGEAVRLSVDSAASPQEAARIFPANYWLSLLEAPAKSELPAGFESPQHWLTEMKLGCIRCHQLGSPAARSRAAGTA